MMPPGHLVCLRHRLSDMLCFSLQMHCKKMKRQHLMRSSMLYQFSKHQVQKAWAQASSIDRGSEYYEHCPLFTRQRLIEKAFTSMQGTYGMFDPFGVLTVVSAALVRANTKNRK